MRFGWRRPGSAVDGRTDPGRWWSLPAAGVVAVLLISAFGVTIAVVTERQRAQQRDQEAVTIAAAAMSDQLARGTTALAGVNGLAADGVVTDDEFQRFASSVAAGSALTSMGREVLVPGADRAAFERAAGYPIIEPDGRGGFTPAGPRDRYVPVVDVEPATDANRATLGYDILSDPARARAADEAARIRSLVLSDPVRLAASGRTGFFAIQPVFAPGAGLIGYVSTAVQAQDFVAAALQRLPAGTAVGLTDGTSVLAGPVTGGATASVNAGGRTWTVRADDPRGPDAALPVVIGTATFLLTGLLGLLAWRGRRFERARAELAGRLAEDAARTERLATVARRLSAAEYLDDVVAIIERDVPGVVGADIADIGLVLDGDNLSMLRADTGLPPDLVDRYRQVPLKLHLPTTEAVRTGGLVLVDDLAAYQRDEPSLLEDVRASGVHSAAAVPLLDATGRSIGVLGLAWLASTTLDSRATMIRIIGELCAKTLERARAADRRHAFILALQKHLLPEPPSLPGLRVLARYQPAGVAVGMGGDWYQFLPQPDGSLVVVIGDVVGHGVEAIAVMAQLQHIIAAAVQTGTPLPKIFAHAHAAVDVDAANATVQVVRVEPARERIGYVSAGHPYALLRRPDATVVALSDAQHPMLGISVPTPTDLATVDFPPGSMVLLYTDGLIERRNRPITEGIQALRTEFARLDPDEPAALDRLIDGCATADREEGVVDDDIAVVLLIAKGGSG